MPFPARTNDSHCLARIVTTGIKVRRVVCLSIGWPKVIEASAEFKAEIASDLPAIGGISLVLIEPEESDGVVVGFAITPKVSQQRISKSVARALGSIRVESERAR